MSKKPPVAPSAKNQRGFAAITPLPAWPAPKTCTGFAVSMYIARSTRIATSETMLAETSVASRPRTLSTGMVRRDSAAIVYGSVIGAAGAGRR